MLANHYQEVIIVDPDNDVLTERAKATLPKTPKDYAGFAEAGKQPRTRVMQSRMLHGTQGQYTRHYLLFQSF